MLDKNTPIDRRCFLTKSLVGLGGLALLPSLNLKILGLDEWPVGEILGRNNVYLPSALPIRSKPTAESPVVRNLVEHECVDW